jgi:hypothetical protein
LLRTRIILVAAVLAGCRSVQTEDAMPKDASAFTRAIEGRWRGAYDLWLMPGSPKESSESTATLKADRMDYQWAREGKTQTGTFVFRGAGPKAEFDWTDTFHSSEGPLKGDGAVSADGKKLTFMTHYGEPAWGWRTEFTRVDPNAFRMEAYNITPQGQEALAVRCDYVRQ